VGAARFTWTPRVKPCPAPQPKFECRVRELKVHAQPLPSKKSHSKEKRRREGERRRNLHTSQDVGVHCRDLKAKEAIRLEEPRCSCV